MIRFNDRGRIVIRFDDRVILAAGEDAATGSRKLDELIDRIAKGEERPLTPKEARSLDGVRAGKFKRRRGQHRSDRRDEQREHRYERYEWLQKLREHLKHDPAEKVIKRAYRSRDVPYVLNKRTAEWAHKLLQQRKLEQMQEHGESFVDYPIRSVESLANLLKRGPK